MSKEDKIKDKKSEDIENSNKKKKAYAPLS